MSLYADAREVIAGGVNSPVRAFAGVGGEPVFFRSASGAWVESEDGRRFIDYVGSWGPMILGHAHPAVLEAVIETARRGLSFGAPCVLETQIATRITELVPSIERLRMVSSGTEATMSAIRLARGHTGRSKIIKFEGCYHGHSDSLLIKAGSGALTLGVPSSPGVPAELAAHTITLPFNDIDAVGQAFGEFGDEIACVIVEPIAGNMNMVPPAPGFLEALQDACSTSGALLIFDEVMTGFRVAKGGAQSLFGIEPDLTTLGVLRATRRTHETAHRRTCRRCGRGRHSRLRGTAWRNVRPGLHGLGTGAEFCAGRGSGRGSVQGLFPRHARRRRLSRAVRLRGRFRIGSARRQ